LIYPSESGQTPKIVRTYNPFQFFFLRSHHRDLALGETESVGVKPEPIVNLVDSDSESDDDSDMVEVLEASPMATVQQLIDAAGTAPIQYLPPDEVLALRTAVVVAPGDQDDLNSLEVSGPTVEAVAMTLLAFVGHYHRQPDSLDAFVPDEDSGVNLHTPDFPAGFFHAGRSYTMSVVVFARLAN
jgi:hypothetical protein